MVLDQNLADEQARNRLAGAIDKYLNNEITNQELDKVVSSNRTNDKLCHEINSETWHFYDDINNQFLHECSSELTTSEVQVLRRWVSILATKISWKELMNLSSENKSATIFQLIISQFSRTQRRSSNIYWPCENYQHWCEFVNQSDHAGVGEISE